MRETSRKISSSEFEQIAKPIFLNLFRVTHPNPYFPEPVPEGFSQTILFPCFYPKGDLARAIMKISRDNGERGFFLSVLGFEQMNTQFDYHWYVVLEEMESFDAKLYPVDFAMYSEKGNWGILSSVETHCILTCGISTLDQIRKAIPEVDNQVYNLLEYYCKSKRFFPPAIKETITNLIFFLYGKKQGDIILIKSDFYNCFANK
jgi:hypothetical protein